MKYVKKNPKVNQILLATDNSRSAQSAEKYAIDLAVYCQAKLIVLHVVEDIQKDIPANINYDEYVTQYVNQKLEDLKDRFQKLPGRNGAGYDYTTVMNVESVADTIHHAAMQLDVDCIVVGSHGRSGVRKNYFGSVTLATINVSGLPVFVIPPGIIFSLRRVAFACKGNLHEMEQLKWVSSSLKKPLDEIELLHVSSEDNIFELDNFIRQARSELSNNLMITFLKNAPAEKALRDFVVERKIDLLALSGKPKSFFQRIFTSNIVKRMVRHGQISILYLPPESCSDD